MIKRRERHTVPVIPTANCVDIAFMLVIFWVACSHFVSQSNLDLQPPKARELAKLDDPLVIVTVDKEGVIRLQGSEMVNPQMVETALSVLLAEKKATQRNVLFRCDARVSRDVFEPVMDAIVNGGGILVAVGENIKEP